MDLGKLLLRTKSALIGLSKFVESSPQRPSSSAGALAVRYGID
jgi:hypothetical protein